MAQVTLPHISTYGQYSSGNYGANTIYVNIGPLEVWYSYRTPVAFRVQGHNRVVHENDWSTTTGKHLNWIDGGDKRSRVSASEFERLWNEQVNPLIVDPYAEQPEPALASVGDFGVNLLATLGDDE